MLESVKYLSNHDVTNMTLSSEMNHVFQNGLRDIFTYEYEHLITSNIINYL